MSKARTRTGPVRAAGVAVGSAALLLGVGQLPAAGDHSTVTAVRGSAFGFFSNVSLFGSPSTTRGPAPTATLPATDAPGPITATAAAPSGSAVYGPATLFTSGPLSLASAGTVGATGGVTTTATVETINTSGREVFTAASVSGTCTASATGASGSTAIVGGTLQTSEGNPDVDGDEVVVPVPSDAAPNTTIEGVIEAVGDSFRYVFNEQITNPDGSLTVNAAHQYLLGPVAVGDLIIGQVVCGVTTAPVPHDNVAPVAGDDSFSTFSDPLTVGTPGVLANDTDANGDALTADSATDPAGGTVTLNPDGSFTYTPDTGFSGADTFTYTATDASGATDTATVTVHVGNSAPVARDDAYTALLGTPLNVPVATGVLSNDFDARGDTLTAGSASDPARGSVTLNPDGSFTYTADAGFSGTDTFTYTATDQAGASDTAIVTVTVSSTPANQPPDAAFNGYHTIRNVPLVVPAPGVLGNDTDPDGDTLTVTSATLQKMPWLEGDSLTVNPDGSFTYTPVPGEIYSTAFTYVVSDGHGGTDTGFVSLSVIPDPRECAGLITTIFGTEGNDTIRGTDGSDVISGLGGNDTIKGLGGDDVICGGAGDDTIDGGDGNDTIEGGDGNDRLRGGDGDDFIDGGTGDDDYDGGAGSDLLLDYSGTSRMNAGPGDDAINAYDGNNTIDGGSGNDGIFGGPGNDTIEGRSGHDEVYAGEGNDTIDGGSGNDGLRGEAGDDLITGGPGDDIISGDIEGFDTCDPGKKAPGTNTYEYCKAGLGATPPP